MRKGKVSEIAIKELKSQLDHIAGYLIITLLLGITYFFFLKTFFIVGNASLRGMFQLFPWILAIFIPAITMGAFAKERESQTIEYLLTKPITSLDLLVGKILGNGIFVSISLLLTIPLPIFISKLGNMDIGETIAGYLGTIVLIFALTTVGVMVSSFFKNQVSAFLSSVVLIISLNLISLDIISINLPISVSGIIAQLSVIDHYFSIIRGVIEVRDIVYFSLLILVSGAIAHINLQKIRVPNIKLASKNILIAVGISLILGGTIIYSSRLAQGRIDLTSNEKYTLSKATKQILREGGKVKVDVYASKDMPNQFKNVFEELKNVLEDYKLVAGDNITIQYLNPKENQEKLQQLGISPVQFNVIGEDQFQVKQGYLAIVISSDDTSNTETINFVSNTANLEYELTSLINKVKSTEKSTIAFASGNGEKNIFDEYQALKGILENEYNVTTVILPGDNENGTKEIPSLNEYKLLVIANPTNLYTEESKGRINEYLKNGGNVLYLVNTLDVNPEFMSVVKGDPQRGALFEDYGVVVNANLVYDLRSNIPVTMSAGNRSVIVPYPFWIRAVKDKDAIVPNIPRSVAVPWANSLELSGGEWNILYQTSPYAGTQSEPFNINPQQQLPNTELNSFPIAATLQITNGGRLVVIGNSELFTDTFISNSQENSVLATSLFEYLSQGKGLSEIRAKNLLSAQFGLISENQKFQIKYIAPAISLLGLILFSIVLRKGRRQRVN